MRHRVSVLQHLRRHQPAPVCLLAVAVLAMVGLLEVLAPSIVIGSQPAWPTTGVATDALVHRADRSPVRPSVSTLGTSAADAGVSARSALSSTHTVFLPIVFTQATGADSPFGVQLFAINEPIVQKVDQARATWIRTPLFWSWIEPVNTTPQNYKWPASLDRQLAGLAARNIKVILTLKGNPSWAATFPSGPIDKVDIGELVEFIQAAVAHYSVAPFYIRHWEFYNEPDNTFEPYALSDGFGFFGNCPEEYVRILEAVYEPIKAVDPDTQVLLGGLAHDFFTPDGPIAGNFVDRIFELGAGDYFDVMNFHYYPAAALNWAPYGIDIMGKATALRNKMTIHNLSKPMICTEASMWTDQYHGGSDELQTRYIPQLYTRSMAADLGLTIWFWLVDAVDTDGVPDWQYGLLNPDLSPKPGYLAYQTAVQQLTGATYVAPHVSDLIEAYEFSTANAAERLIVAWSRHEQEYPFVLEAEELVLIDKFGAASTIHDADDGLVDGRVQVNLGPSPVYLRFRR